MGKYGWVEGQGLGRLCDGSTEVIQAVRRDEKFGLGSQKRKSEDQWDNWWADCFNNVAGKLAIAEGATPPGHACAAVQSESESDSDVDVERSHGGRVFAVKKAGAM